MCSRVYVGRLPYDVRERDLEDFFERYSPFKDIVVKDNFAFVEFTDPRDAEDAAYYMNGKKLLGERVTVELAKRPPKGRDVYRTSGTRYLAEEYDRRRDPYPDYYSNSRSRGSSRSYSTRWRIRVENLSTGVSWQDLKDFMRQEGEVTYVDAHSKYEREGVVCFASEREMFRALDRLDGANLNGRKIRLINDSSSRRSASYSRSPTRSYSTSRSRSRSYTRSRTRSRSRSRSRNYTRSRSRSRSYSSSRSRSGTRSVSRSPSRGKDRASRQKGRSRSRSSDLSAASAGKLDD